MDQPEGRAIAGFFRPYAQATQGRLQQVCFKWESGIFDLQYVAQPEVDRPTRVCLPATQYPQGVQIACTGPVLRHEYDESSQILQIWASAAGAISVRCTRVV
ncbi:MAG: hypothetical protein K2Q97_19850 [Burkholderiaceae bacterium]|nr:hypothetical protein [Burkholderiaceae bacterium]